MNLDYLGYPPSLPVRVCIKACSHFVFPLDCIKELAGVQSQVFIAPKPERWRKWNEDKRMHGWVCFRRVYAHTDTNNLRRVSPHPRGSSFGWLSRPSILFPSFISPLHALVAFSSPLAPAILLSSSFPTSSSLRRSSRARNRSEHQIVHLNDRFSLQRGNLLYNST